MQKSIAFNSIAWLTSQATILVVSILQSVVVSRILGPELRGVFYVFSNGLVLIVTFVNLGIGTANVVFVAKRTYSVAEVFTNSVMWACGLGLTLVVLFAVWPDLLMQSIFKNVPYWWVWVAVGLVPTSIFTMYWNEIMVGLNKIALLGWIGAIIEVISSALILVGLGLFHLPPYSLVILLAINGGVTTALFIWLLARAAPLSFRWNSALFRQSLRLGLTKHLGNSTSYLLLRADTFLLNLLAGPLAVGYYSLAVTFAEQIWQVLSALGRATYSVIAAAESGRAERLTAATCRHSVLLGSVVSLTLGVGSTWFVRILYGEEYVPAVLPLILLLPGVVLFGVVRVLDSYFTGQLARPRIPTLITVAVMVVAVPVYYYLIRGYAEVGAALATTIVYTLNAVIAVAVFVRLTGFSLADVLIPNRSDLRAYWKLAQAGLVRFRTNRYVDQFWHS